MRRFASVAATSALSALLSGCGGRGGGHPPPPVLPEICATTTTTTRLGNWSGYSCSSTRKLQEPVQQAHRKGFAVDDPTLATCSDEILAEWPHSPGKERVTSLRLLSAWKNYWNENEREVAWTNLKTFVENQNALVLLGLDLLCDLDNDNWEWEQAFALMKVLGKERIMGIAFGNNMDNKDQCRDAFKNGDFFRQAKAWVDTMDAEGFDSVRLTVAWSMGVLGTTSDPAPDLFKLEFEPFLNQSFALWGDRFAWTFNPYPSLEESMKPQSADECNDKIAAATGAWTRSVMGICRERVTNFTGNPESVLWVGESGWSSPVAKAQRYIEQFCPAWASVETLFKFYETLMDWDLSVPNDTVTGEPINGVDHMFFFTMRDFNGESFGLINQCCEQECKIQASLTRLPLSPWSWLESLV